MTDNTKFINRFDRLNDWFQKRFHQKVLTSAAGAPLRVALQNSFGSRALVVILTGRTEFIEKYLELARNISSSEFSVCIYDHCGQGGSGRLLADPQKGHIDRFETYISDLHQVIEMAAAKGQRTPVILVAHSMGGTISTLYEMRYPERVERLVLGSPMFAIKTGVVLPDFLTEKLVAAACRVGLGDHFAPTTGPYNYDMAFENNALTSDKFRFDYNRFLTDHLDFSPLGGPTYRWLHEAFKAMRSLRQNVGRIGCPVLAMTASDDQVIDVGCVARLAAILPELSYKEYRLRGHELYMERDEIRDDVLERINEFLAID